MLLNNLDPEVAEHPEQLIVYGGSGKAARSPEALRAIVRSPARPARGRDAARPERQAGRRVQDAPGSAARPDRERPARAALGHLGRVQAPRGARPDDVRPDDRRELDLHRHPGDPPGDVPDVRGGRGDPLRVVGPARADDPHRRPRRHGRRAAARRDDGRRRHPLRRGRPDPDRPQARRPLPRRGDRLARRRARAGAPRPPRREPRSRSACSATRPRWCRSSRGAASSSTSSPTRRPPTTRSTATSPPGSRSRRPPSFARATPASTFVAPPSRSRAMFAACSSSSGPGSYVFDYGNNLRGEAQQGGVEDAFTYPGFVPAYIRPLFCRGIGPFRWAVLSGDPEDIAAIDGALRELFPDDLLLQRWLELAPERVAFQGLPARICWLGYGDRAKAGLAINEPRPRRRRLGPGRDRARPSRLGLGRLALPGDRGDAGRLRRHRRLADPERAPEHGGGSDLGQRPPRRRRRASATRSTRAWSSSPTAPTTPRSASSGC